MSKPKTYSLLNLKFLFFLLIIFILFFSLILCSIGTIKILSEFGKNLKINIAGILLFVLNSFLIFFIGRIIYMYITYVSHERNKIVKIDTENETLTFSKNSNQNIIDSKNIERVELYLSTSNYRSLLRYFEYVKIITKDNKEYIITNFILNCSIFEKLFENVKKTKKLSDKIFLK